MGRRELRRLQNHYVSGTKWLEEHDIFIVSTVAEHFNASSLISVFQEIANKAE